MGEIELSTGVEAMGAVILKESRLLYSDDQPRDDAGRFGEGGGGGKGGGGKGGGGEDGKGGEDAKFKYEQALKAVESSSAAKDHSAAMLDKAKAGGDEKSIAAAQADYDTASGIHDKMVDALANAHQEASNKGDKASEAAGRLSSDFDHHFAKDFEAALKDQPETGEPSDVMEEWHAALGREFSSRDYIKDHLGPVRELKSAIKGYMSGKIGKSDLQAKLKETKAALASRSKKALAETNRTDGDNEMTERRLTYVSQAPVLLGEKKARGEILRTGSWVYKGEPMDITKEKLAQAEANFRAHKRDVMLDYDHGSRVGKTPEERKRAADLLDVQVVENADGSTSLFGDFAPTPEAEKYIENREYKYLSAEFDEDYFHPEDKNQIGMYLQAVALTNRPFIEGMAPMVLMSEGAQKVLDEGGATGYCVTIEAGLGTDVAELVKKLEEQGYKVSSFYKQYSPMMAERVEPAVPPVVPAAPDPEPKKEEPVVRTVLTAHAGMGCVTLVEHKENVNG
jgi:hypothetical protein